MDRLYAFLERSLFFNELLNGDGDSLLSFTYLLPSFPYISYYSYYFDHSVIG